MSPKCRTRSAEAIGPAARIGDCPRAERQRGATILHHRLPGPFLAALVTLTFGLATGGNFAGSPAVAETPAAAAGDPVVAEVVRLLDAGLGEPLVLRWLAESGKTLGRPTADDLVALKKAGASDDLIAALLDRSRAGTAATKPAPTAGSTSATAPTAPAAAATSERTAPVPVTPAPTPAAAAESEPRMAAPALPAPSPTPAATADTTTVVVAASLRYIHVPEEGEPWDLVVYLDGTPFDPLPAAPSSASAGTWTEQRSLAPGRHVLSWSQELHRKDRQGRMQHSARFDPEPLPFELEATSSAAIEFEYRDRTGLFLRMGGPVTVRVSQGGRELVSRNSSGDPAAWPNLCEEIEANLGGKKPGFLERQDLRACLRWADLWSGVPGVPARDAARPPGK